MRDDKEMSICISQLQLFLDATEVLREPDTTDLTSFLPRYMYVTDRWIYPNGVLPVLLSTIHPI